MLDISKRIAVDQDIVEAAVIGGAILAGGEGGSIEYGRRLGTLAVQMGGLTIADMNTLPEDANLINVAVVGASAPKERHLEPRYHVMAIEKFMKFSDMKLDAIITNASGGTSTVNGWLQSVILGIPVVDAMCNGRNSPTSIPGLGLHKLQGYDSIQVGVGGNPKTGSLIEVYAKGNIFKTTNIIRQAAIEAGGAVAVARNPISVSYAKNNVAIGGISKAIELGKMVLEHEWKCSKIVNCICSFLNGNVVAKGKVKKFNLHTIGCYDYGLATVGENKERCTIGFFNQYIYLEINGERIAQFPDLIIVISKQSGLPVGSSQLVEGQEVVVIVVSKDNLILGTNLDVNLVIDQINKYEEVRNNFIFSES